MVLCTKYPKYLEKGEVYGRLTVIEVDEKSKVRDGKKVQPSNWKYECLCSCGKTTYVVKDNLCGNHTRSCGCLRYEQLCDKYPKYLTKGGVFGYLTIVSLDETSKIKHGKVVRPSQWKYLCKCQCGNYVSVVKMSLCRGNTKSCGCYGTEVRTRNRPLMRKINPIKVKGDTTKIYLFNTDNYALVDTEDYPKIKEFCWYENNGYVRKTQRSGEETALHRIILNTNVGDIVDHISGVTLDNRKKNLRLCTTAENIRNSKVHISSTSGYNGVTWYKAGQKWTSNITINKKHIHLGRFENKQDAIDARLKAEIEYFGDFAPSLCRGL